MSSGRSIGPWLGAAILIGAVGAGGAEVPDPTRPSPTTPSALGNRETSSTETSRAGLALQSILVKGDIRRAVINGRAVNEDDRVGRYRVRTIQSRRVVLDGPEGRRVLRIGGEGLQKRKVAPQ